jgi:hypothetical protein
MGFLNDFTEFVKKKADPNAADDSDDAADPNQNQSVDPNATVADQTPDPRVSQTNPDGTITIPEVTVVGIVRKERLLTSGQWSSGNTPTLGVQGGRNMRFAVNYTGPGSATVSISAQNGQSGILVIPDGESRELRFSLDQDVPIGWTFEPGGLLAFLPEDVKAVGFNLFSDFLPGDPPD